MRTAYLLDPLTGQVVTFDAILSETHEHASDVTRHPVSTGAAVTDHIIYDPDTVTLVGVVSNSTIRADLQGRGGDSIFSLSYPSHPTAPTLQGAIGLLKSLVGLTSDPRVSAVKSFSVNGLDKIQETHDALLAMRASVLDVVTSTRTYTNMVLQSINYPRTEADMADFTIVLTHIRRVAVRTVTAPKPKVPAALVAQNKGSQATAPPPPAKSLAVKLLASAGAF